MRNTHLIQLQRCPGDLLAGVTGEGEGGLLACPKTQADPPPAFSRLLVIMQPTTLSRVCIAVKQHRHAQHIAIKGQGFFHIPGANGNVGYCACFHSVLSSKRHTYRGSGPIVERLRRLSSLAVAHVSMEDVSDSGSV